MNVEMDKLQNSTCSDILLSLSERSTVFYTSLCFEKVKQSNNLKGVDICSKNIQCFLKEHTITLIYNQKKQNHITALIQ